ncbi:MAG: 6,7-dimethyl-8-ribityllumazine synthase [Muribaculaceae bacterium]|nr:6,7-dimethyl-8-ribityllumazine synthase [Muribaculaceae bacterium]
MSTILNTNGAELHIPKPYNKDTFVCDIVTAEWNPDVTHALRDGAVTVLLDAGVRKENIRCHSVPGTVELVNAAGVLVKRRPDAVIVIGCVIRGDTPHFDYVCQQAATGAAIINARGETPLIFGILTVDNLAQALERAGGALGNKGAEAAVAAIDMANFHASIC